MSQASLLEQVVTTFRADSTLVTLTDHTSTDLRINRALPQYKAKKSGLYIRVVNQSPTLVDLSSVLRTTVAAEAVGFPEVTAIQIADRVTSMLQASSNTEYLDFTGNGIITKSTTFSRRGERYFNDKADIYVDPVFFITHVLEGTCP